MIVVDGNGLVFGRLATVITKKLLGGESVSLINAESITLSGKPSVIIEKFKERRGARNKANPENSPKWPRLPHFLVKKMIRGMLPPDTSRGRNALKRLMVYSGNPKKLDNPLPINGIECNRNKPFITIGKLCKRM